MPISSHNWLFNVKNISGNLRELLNMTIEIVSFPVKSGDLSLLCGRLPEGIRYGPEKHVGTTRKHIL